jgi:hypothetical protein
MNKAITAVRYPGTSGWVHLGRVNTIILPQTHTTLGSYLQTVIEIRRHWTNAIYNAPTQVPLNMACHISEIHNTRPYISLFVTTFWGLRSLHGVESTGDIEKTIGMMISSFNDAASTTDVI